MTRAEASVAVAAAVLGPQIPKPLPPWLLELAGHYSGKPASSGLLKGWLADLWR
jgi:hypothetical protein